MSKVKFFVGSVTGFVNDRHLWATDNEDVERYIKSIYEGEFEELSEVTEEDARWFLNGNVSHPPAPMIEYASMDTPYPSASKMIKWLVESAQNRYDLAAERGAAL